MVNKQFPGVDLPTKFMLLKLARAEKIADVNFQEVGLIDLKFKDQPKVKLFNTIP